MNCATTTAENMQRHEKPRGVQPSISFDSFPVFVFNIAMRIGIVGASVAGSRLAEKLSARGQEVLLFDPRAPWEKPCGGGLTPQAVAEFPELAGLNLERSAVSQVHFIGPTGRRSLLPMREPWFTVSRQELGRFMLERAQSAGAKFFPQRVSRVVAGPRPAIETAEQTFAVDYLVGADGAAGLCHHALVGKWPAGDLCLCYGYLLPWDGPVPLSIRFFSDMLGYAWLFPRPGRRFSAGIAASGSNLARDPLVARLKSFVSEEFQRTGQPAPVFPKPYAALLPALDPAGFGRVKVEGEKWALVGDASGAVDPITGEGITYALRTARLLTEALLDGGRSYTERWRAMAQESIGRAANMRARFYDFKILWLFSLFVKYSPTVGAITQDLLFGSQSYSELKPRVLGAAPRIVLESLFSILTGRSAA